MVYSGWVMEQASATNEKKLRQDLCGRCLQPLPPKATRCPGCNQPAHSTHRRLPLVFGVVGLFALAFIMLIMYVMAGNEDMAKGPGLVDQGAQSPDAVLRDASDTSAEKPAADKPEKPEKPPPLNEK